MGIYKCDECKVEFSTLRELMMHRKDSGHLLACPKCPKRFVQKKNFDKAHQEAL